ncbi:MAG: hypothetical protein K1X55_14775, partial [Chitinophagales bacterium]|nr:hypothetical protein [Chitinophagales bacterium]
MKNIYKFLLLTLVTQFSITKTCAQVISLENTNTKKIANTLQGYNLSRQWSFIINLNADGSYNGEIDPDAIAEYNNLNINTLRFPGGGISNDYHRWRNGFGERIDEGPVNILNWDPAITNASYQKMKDENATNNASTYQGYAGWNNPNGGQGNIIFPFMKYVKDLNSDKNGDGVQDNNIKVMYVLNIIPHFSFHDNLRNELITKVATIESITSLADLESKKNQGLISQKFYELVKENYDAITDLNTEIGVAGVEMGNELANTKYQSDYTLADFKKTSTTLFERIDLHQKIYTSTDTASLRYYVALVGMYSKIIKNSITNGANIKIGVPLLDDNGYINLWNYYMNNHMQNFSDAYILHNYFFKYDPLTLTDNLDTDFPACRDSMNYYLDKKLSEFIGLKNGSLLGNKKLWITEWEVKMDAVSIPGDPYGPNRRKVGNTLLQAMYNFEYFLTMLDANNLTTDSEFIPYATHQFSSDADLGTSENPFPTYELSNMSYNAAQQSVKQRANYIAASILKPLCKDSLYICNGTTNILQTNPNIKNRVFYKPGGASETDGGTLYIYYSNKTEADIAAGLGALSMISTSYDYAIQSIHHTFATADKLYASRGTTAFLNDETLYNTNLNKTIQFSEDILLSSLNTFNYRKYSIGYLEIKLTKTPNGSSGGSCSYLNFTNTGGAGDFVNMPAIALQNISKSSFTIELKARGFSNTNYMVLLSNAPQTFYPFKNNLTVAYSRYNGTNRLEIWLNGKKFVFLPCKNLNDSKWHHIAIVRNANMLSAYVDGIICNSKTYTNTIESPTVASGWSIGGGNKYKTTGTTTWGSYFGFTGDIDEVRIWNVARSVSDINTYKNTTINPQSNGLVGYWDFNSTGSQIIDDLSSTNNNGSLGLNVNVGTDDPTYLNSGCNARLSEEETTIEAVQIPTEENLRIFPNPSKSVPEFEFFATTPGEGILNIFNIEGKLIFSKNIYIEEGYNYLNDAIIHLNSGFYIAEIHRQSGNIF